MNNMFYNDNLYGDYRNMIFSEIFGDVESFKKMFDEAGMITPLTPENISTLYYTLYGQYGNSPIASSDINRFKYQLMTICNTEGPIYFKKLDIQLQLSQMPDSVISEGNTVIYNTALNPSTTPSTDTMYELEHINTQNVQKQKRGRVEGYRAILMLMDEDLTKKFVARFRKLFLTFVSPEQALWYATLKPNTPIKQEEN